MTEYTIVGDCKGYIGCLVFICGTNKEEAEKILDKFINNPDEGNLRTIGKCVNLRLEESEAKDNWWNKWGTN